MLIAPHSQKTVCVHYSNESICFTDERHNEPVDPIHTVPSAKAQNVGVLIHDDRIAELLADQRYCWWHQEDCCLHDDLRVSLEAVVHLPSTHGADSQLWLVLLLRQTGLQALYAEDILLHPPQPGYAAVGGSDYHGMCMLTYLIFYYTLFVFGRASLTVLMYK